MQCDLEFSLLEGVQTSVERLYQDGRPLHHQASARCSKNSPGASSIFVVDFASFSHMSGREIQDIFRERHILVVGVPNEQMSFNVEGLATLGSLVLPRQGQGN